MTGFFMLSGYALQTAYGGKDMKNNRNIKDFYLKRFISIYPLYIVVGFLSVAMKTVAGLQTVEDNLKLLPVELLGIQSFFDGSLFKYAHNGGTWFISCILICYFVFPLIKELLKGISVKAAMIGLLVLALLLSYIQLLPRRFECGDLYTNAFIRLLEFALGMLVAKLNMEGKGKGLIALRSWSLLIISIGCLIVGMSICNHYGVRGDLLMYVCLTVMFISLGNIKTSENENNYKAILYASSVSYAFYLSQFLVWKPTKFLEMHVGEFDNFTKIIGTFVVCVIFTTLLHEIVEKRFGKYLKNQLIYKNNS